MSQPRAATLTDKLNRALRRERWEDAFEIYAELGLLEPEEPRWPNREGDLHRRLGQHREAARCYERAVDRYAEQGFVARAAAMAKVLLSIDPTRLDVLARVDPTRARALMDSRRRAAKRDHAAAPRPRLSGAPLLANASEGAPDEIGFEDLSPQDVVELELSDMELVGRPAPPLPPPAEEHECCEVIFIEEEPSPSAEELASLPSSPLFAELPEAALTRLLTSAGLVEAEAGQPLLRFGEPADALLVITEGRAEVRVPGLEHAPPIQLGEGDVVGESCLLDDVTRRADVIARSPLRALSLPKTTLDELVVEHPEVGEVLTQLLGRRLLGNLLATSELFAAFDPESKRALSRLFEVRRAEEQTELLGRGKRSDGLYVVLAGKLGLRVESGEERLLGAGEVVGERSLLDHAPSDFDCWAATDVLLLRLPRSRFVELCASYPPVLASLAELASRADAPGSTPLA